MKHTTRTKTVWVEIWETSDGKEFKSQEEAEEHEKELEEKKEMIQNYEIISFDKHIYPIEESINADSSYTWYKVNRKEELEALNEVYDLDFVKSEFPNEYPFTLYVEENYGSTYYGTYDLSVENAKKFFDAFGYEMILKKKEK